MSDLSDISAYYSARPSLRVDGRDMPALSEGLINLLIEETVEGLYRCELTVGNWGDAGTGLDYLYFSGDGLDFGGELEITAGDGSAEATVFKGRISGIEARYHSARPHELTVLAEDRLQDLRMTRRTRSFEDSSDGDIARTIAGDHGLRPEIDVDGPSWPLLTQVNQSDLAFLRERARAVDAEVWVESGALHMQSRARRNTESLSLTLGERLREFSVLADLAGQASSFTVTGWDPAAKETVEVTTRENAISNELGNAQRSGATVLSSAFAERDQRIIHQLPTKQAQAQALADAHFRRTARRFVRGQGLAEGDARLRVGAQVTLHGLGPWFEGEYQVIESRHMFDTTNGYQTAFRVERPGLGESS